MSQRLNDRLSIEKNAKQESLRSALLELAWACHAYGGPDELTPEAIIHRAVNEIQNVNIRLERQCGAQQQAKETMRLLMEQAFAANESKDG